MSCIVSGCPVHRRLIDGAVCRKELHAEAVTDARLLDDPTSGHYMACIVRQYGERMSKLPGFMLWGYPIAGNALLVGGQAVMHEKQLFERHLDVTVEPIWAKCREAEASIAWLDVHEVRRAKGLRNQRALDMLKTTNMPNAIVFGNPPARIPLKLAKGATTCLACGVDDSAELKCARCCAAYYCSKSCQVAHWPAHKANCTSKR